MNLKKYVVALAALAGLVALAAFFLEDFFFLPFLEERFLVFLALRLEVRFLALRLERRALPELQNWRRTKVDPVELN